MGLREKWGWFFMIISVIIIIMGFGYEVSGCFEDEKQALLQLKSVFKFRENYLSSWSINEGENGDDCYCDGWEGVTCGSSGHLISLSLPPHYDYVLDDYTWLKVDFNASILLPFRGLRELNLSSNGILTWTEQTKGSIKLSSSLTKLEILDLSQNYLDSNILQHLSGFHSLRNLSLSFNNIKGYVHLNETKNLPTRLLPKLEFLDLSGNTELGSNVTVLSIASALPSLKHLKLSTTGLNGQIKVDDLEAMKNLEELDLSENAITSFLNYNETKNLPTRLLPKLEFLDLSLNIELGSNNILSIASALPSLKHLKLSGVGLNGQIKLDDFEVMKNLEELDLSVNHITSFLNYNVSIFRGRLASPPKRRLAKPIFILVHY